MNEQEPAQQALMEMFRRDRAEAAAHPPRKPRWLLESRTLAWILGVAVVIFILAPVAFVVIYPRVGPVDTMTSFCTAEGVGEYATAYGLLSQRAQQQVSLEAFTQESRAANLESCTVNGGIPIILGGSQARLDVNYQLINSNQIVAGSMTFVRESGGWRVDTASVPPLFLNS